MKAPKKETWLLRSSCQICKYLLSFKDQSSESVTLKVDSQSADRCHVAFRLRYWGKSRQAEGGLETCIFRAMHDQIVGSTRMGSSSP